MNFYETYLKEAEYGKQTWAGKGELVEIRFESRSCRFSRVIHSARSNFEHIFVKYLPTRSLLIKFSRLDQQ